MAARSAGLMESMSVYVFSNEYQIGKTLCDLRNFPRSKQPAVHVGVSGWQNYDMALCRRNEYMVLIDANPMENYLHKITEEVLLVAKDVDDFVDLIVPKLRASQLACPFGTEEYIRNRKAYWLQDRERFEKIQNMFKEKRVVINVLNYADTAMVEKLQKFLPKSWNLSLEDIDTFYVSNVGEWLGPTWHYENYRQNLMQLFQVTNRKMITVYATKENLPVLSDLKARTVILSRGCVVSKMTTSCPSEVFPNICSRYNCSH